MKESLLSFLLFALLASTSYGDSRSSRFCVYQAQSAVASGSSTEPRKEGPQVALRMDCPLEFDVETSLSQLEEGWKTRSLSGFSCGDSVIESLCLKMVREGDEVLLFVGADLSSSALETRVLRLDVVLHAPNPDDNYLFKNRRTLNPRGLWQSGVEFPSYAAFPTDRWERFFDREGNLMLRVTLHARPLGKNR